MSEPQPTPLATTCCIVGGGPAGILLGFLLARAGIDVTVLEKHADFFRDFRGDTVHPSTLELIRELGLLDPFLALPHQQIASFTAVVGGQSFPIAQLDRVPTQSKFVALMPQWDFLNFFAAQAARFPCFHLLMQHEAIGLTADASGRVTGVRVHTPSAEHEARDIRATLTVACDGRHSLMRADAELPLRETGVPIDVLWFRIPRRAADPSNVIGNINYGAFAVLINRNDYFQCAFIIKKGSFPEVRRAGLPAFRASIARLVPFLSDRVDTLTSWDEVKLLTVQINHLTQWHRPGFLAIGDAAHAMSPVGGVGINLAIQDAVAAARILAPHLRTAAELSASSRPFTGGFISGLTLSEVQHRRQLPTRLTQAFQVFAHRQLSRVLGNPAPIHPPRVLRILSNSVLFRRTVARVIAVGIRPEHINPVH